MSITLHRLGSAHWEATLRNLVEQHHTATDSRWSGAILEDWERCKGRFWQVVPKEMLTRLPHQLLDDAAGEPGQAVAAA